MTVGNWLLVVTKKLSAAGVNSAPLDAQLLLANTLGKSLEYLLAHPETELQSPTLRKLEQVALRRANREPLAYILGKKEFYGRDFIATPDVLIPRPESESFIDLIKELSPKTVVDIGTGSGCLAITAKLELPNTQVIAVDIDKSALKIARVNAKRHKAKVEFIKSDLLDSLPSSIYRPLSIIANLPYVDKSWKVSPEIGFEPSQALYADKSGLDLIQKLIVQARKYLTANDFLLIEADLRQHQDIDEYARQHSLSLLKKDGLIVAYKLQV